jgi:hypothetical protein
MPVKPTPAPERIRVKIHVDSNGCWIFTGAKNEQGYGFIQLGRGIGTDRTHRVMYEAEVGPIPEGLTLDHLCAVPSCCNPAHLEPVTRSENTRRQWADGRADPGRFCREKTHCPQGHPYDEANTHINKRGSRVCRACHRERARRVAAAKKENP